MAQVRCRSLYGSILLLPFTVHANSIINHPKPKQTKMVPASRGRPKPQRGFLFLFLLASPCVCTSCRMPLGRFRRYPSATMRWRFAGLAYPSPSMAWTTFDTRRKSKHLPSVAAAHWRCKRSRITPPPLVPAQVDQLCEGRPKPIKVPICLSALGGGGGAGPGHVSSSGGIKRTHELTFCRGRDAMCQR